jgi:hypothetical protein
LKDLRKAGELLSDSGLSEGLAAVKSRRLSRRLHSSSKKGRRGPIGILADFSQMEGADWKARWNEMRFLQKYTDHIARMAVVGADKWEEVVAMLLAGTAVLQAETRYFATSEIATASDWARSSKNADHIPVRRMYLGTGLFKDYVPEHADM